jgi:hypothetical protein
MANSELYIQQNGAWRPCTNSDMAGVAASLTVEPGVEPIVITPKTYVSVVVKEVANTAQTINAPGVGKAFFITYMKGFNSVNAPTLTDAIALQLATTSEEVIAPGIPIRTAENTLLKYKNFNQLIYYIGDV